MLRKGTSPATIEKPSGRRTRIQAGPAHDGPGPRRVRPRLRGGDGAGLHEPLPGLLRPEERRSSGSRSSSSSSACPPKLSEDRDLKLIIRGRVAFLERRREGDASQRISLTLESRYVIKPDGSDGDVRPADRPFRELALFDDVPHAKITPGIIPGSD